MQSQFTSETETLIISALAVENVFDAEEQFDVNVKLEDANPKLVAEVVERFTFLFVEQFQDSVEVRFPESREMTVPEAFEILNPEMFPALGDPEMKNFKQEISTFGTDQPKVLLDWYGTPKEREGHSVHQLWTPHSVRRSGVAFVSICFRGTPETRSRQFRACHIECVQKRGRVPVSLAIFLSSLSCSRLRTWFQTRQLTVSESCTPPSES